jgi:hypothetical protein
VQKKNGVNTGTETARIEALRKPTAVRKVKKSVVIKRVIFAKSQR